MADDTSYKMKDVNNMVLINDTTIAYTGKLNDTTVICIVNLTTGKCNIVYRTSSECILNKISIIHHRYLFIDLTIVGSFVDIIVYDAYEKRTITIENGYLCVPFDYGYIRIVDNSNLEVLE